MDNQEAFDASQLFDISIQDACSLFIASIYPRKWGSILHQNATPKEVANSIKKYVEWRKNNG